MDGVPNDIIPIIFNFITLITDKRQFLRTCKRINVLNKKLMIQCENNFDPIYFDKIKKYCVEKFTLELCHDKYFHLIPLTYLNPNNMIIVQTLATFGSLELLQIAINNGCELVSNGYLSVAYDIFKYSKVPYTNDVCALAAQNGHINVIEFCLNNGCQLNWISCLLAAKNGHLHVVEWLLKNNCPTNDYVRETAAFNGHYDVIKLLIRGSYFMNYKTYAAAAENGHLNILKLLKENCPLSMDHYIGERAALNGHLDVLKWLHENNYRFNAKTCSAAALNGHLDVIIWLKENGCILDNMTLTLAIKNGHLNVLKWLMENDDQGYDKEEIFESATMYGHINILEWLNQNGYDLNFDYICETSITYGNVNVIKWLGEHNYKWTNENCSHAIHHNSLDTLILMTNDGFQWEKHVVRNIMNGNKVKIINWAKTALKQYL